MQSSHGGSCSKGSCTFLVFSSCMSRARWHVWQLLHYMLLCASCTSGPSPWEGGGDLFLHQSLFRGTGMFLDEGRKNMNCPWAFIGINDIFLSSLAASWGLLTHCPGRSVIPPLLLPKARLGQANKRAQTETICSCTTKVAIAASNA